jgi:hypothetical protein
MEHKKGDGAAVRQKALTLKAWRPQDCYWPGQTRFLAKMAEKLARHCVFGPFYMIHPDRFTFTLPFRNNLGGNSESMEGMNTRSRFMTACQPFSARLQCRPIQARRGCNFAAALARIRRSL